MRALRHPALHFAALGAMLFVLERRLPLLSLWPTSTEVTIPATRIAARERRFFREIGRPPTPGERAALVEEAMEEEVLYREAVARGLDRNDRSIRGHLAEKMRFLDASSGASPADTPALAARAIAVGLDRDDAFVRRVLVEKMRLLARREGEEAEPDDATLAAFMAEHPERWQLPMRVTLAHVFLREARAAEAVTLLARLRAGTADPARTGDPLPSGRVVRDATAPTLAKLLGEEIAAHALTAALAEWSGPLRSPWGTHLVRLGARTEPELPAVADVRSRLALAWRAERRLDRERATLGLLRQRWRVRVQEGEV